MVMSPMTLIVADYDQLEVKIAAHVSGDEVLIDTLRLVPRITCRRCRNSGSSSKGLRSSSRASR